ncbi:MAG: LON peptidase substrate-binding domain-containing protein [Proteobacteria bacterium]|nr:LON peptidase substrate-binding domain-containing protein [Pseudomonadota bacterium]
MTREETTVDLDSLPGVLPIFPLAGVLLLPHAQLPLNIFEKRYLAMTRDALAGHRLIGMVQPVHPEDQDTALPAVYDNGCAGRITSFKETDDGRLLITLTGLCRFAIKEEQPMTQTGYRVVHADYGRFASDLHEPAAARVDRKRLMRALDAFFSQQGYEADWSTVESASNESLITTLAMTCPFAPSEKQALLEARDTEMRAEIVISLMEMTVADKTHAGEGSIQ